MARSYAVMMSCTRRCRTTSLSVKLQNLIPSTLARIFEPLFSTKSFGVGLGLPTVKQIMEQHGGDIEITSGEGQGTRVLLWLPVKQVQEQAA